MIIMTTLAVDEYSHTICDSPSSTHHHWLTIIDSPPSQSIDIPYAPRWPSDAMHVLYRSFNFTEKSETIYGGLCCLACSLRVTLLRRRPTGFLLPRVALESRWRINTLVFSLPFPALWQSVQVLS